MAEQLDEGLGELVDSVEDVDRILLLVEGGRDRQLLADRLGDRYEVVLGEPAGQWDPFDICVVDATTYGRVKSSLAARKRSSQTYLPVLLLVPDSERSRGTEWLGEELKGPVDDVLVVPAPKHELDARVGALLRARQQSKTLALYRRAIDEATIGITVTDPDRPDNPIVYVNDGFVRLTGYDREAAVGRNCRFLQGPDTDESSIREVREAIDAEEPVTVEILNYRADGESFWNLLTVTPVRDDNGTVSHFLGFQQDVTERVERERQVRRERERFEALARTATDAILVVDPEGTIVYANTAVERVFGHDPNEITGAPLTRLMPERYREAHREGVQRYVETGERSLDWEMVRFRGLHAEGHEVPLEISFADFEGDEGPLFAGIIRDITDRMELEDELRSETELLERVFDTSPTGITVVDASGDITRANEAAERELGLETFELVSWTYDDPAWEVFDTDGEPIPPEELPVSRVLETGEPVRDFRHGIRVDGEERWLSVNAAPLTDEDGDIETVVNSVRNITDRLERERELERYETIVETTTEPIYVLNPEGHFTHVNDALVEVTGYSREELLGSHVSLVAPEEDVRRAEEFITTLLTEGHDRGRIEASLVSADGTRRLYSTSFAVLREEGTFQGTVVVGHDVTDLRQHQHRLSVLDRVLRHNVRNKLGVVLGHARDLAEREDSDTAASADAICRAATELLELSESARKFESVIAGTPQPIPLNVADGVHDAVERVRQNYPTAHISVDVPEGVSVRAHETFDLALEELLENAIIHDDSEEPTVEISVTIGSDHVDIHVADDGPGFEDTDRQVLLRGAESPLEHTQGIGLWLVRWSLETVGGEIDIIDNEPQGSIVTITLPRLE